MIFGGGQLPRLILGYFAGPRELGLFVLATRILDIIVNTALFPRVAVGRIELRRLQPSSPEFRRYFARMEQDVALLSFPILLGTAALMPDLFRVWLDQRWLDGIVPAQLVILSGLPLVFTYCLDVAFLAANLSSYFRRMATAQAVTVIATVLCAAPFGLNVACLALAVRPWLLLPFLLSMFRRRCGVPAFRLLEKPLLALFGAVLMAAILKLPFLSQLWLGAKLNFAFLILTGVAVYGTFSYGFAREELRALLASLFAKRP